jgi:hypothetical protein
MVEVPAQSLAWASHAVDKDQSSGRNISLLVMNISLRSDLWWWLMGVVHGSAVAHRLLSAALLRLLTCKCGRLMSMLRSYKCTHTKPQADASMERATGKTTSEAVALEGHWAQSRAVGNDRQSIVA